MMTPTLSQKLAARTVFSSDGCWLHHGERLWNGYTRVWIDRRHVLAHRAVYELLIGPIPKGMQLDHLCRERSCVNPDHLEVVTPQENALRGEGIGGINARKTHCPRDHPYTPENTVGPEGNRQCRTCSRDRGRRRRAEAKAARLSSSPGALRLGDG